MQSRNLFCEGYARFKLAEFLGIPVDDVLHLSLQNPHVPYDLQYRDKKYDVKVASPTLISKQKKHIIWDFDLRSTLYRSSGNIKLSKPLNIADYYLLIGMQNSMPKRIFLIPCNRCPKSHLRISIVGKSKYHKYEI